MLLLFRLIRWSLLILIRRTIRDEWENNSQTTDGTRLYIITLESSHLLFESESLGLSLGTSDSEVVSVYNLFHAK